MKWQEQVLLYGSTMKKILRPCFWPEIWLGSFGFGGTWPTELVFSKLEMIFIINYRLGTVEFSNWVPGRWTNVELKLFDSRHRTILFYQKLNIIQIRLKGKKHHVYLFKSYLYFKLELSKVHKFNETNRRKKKKQFIIIIKDIQKISNVFKQIQ